MAISKIKIIPSKIWRKFALLYANLNYENKRQYLIKKGASIGKNTRMNCNVDSFGTEPYLIEVGEDCLFASGVRFITHDGGGKVLNTLNKFENKTMDIIAPIKIGNNVYIGMGAYILPGVSIGDNSIIGAGAVVSKSIPSNSVAVGVPAKVIETIDEYYSHTNNKGNLYETCLLNEDEKRIYFEKNGLLSKYFN